MQQREVRGLGSPLSPPTTGGLGGSGWSHRAAAQGPGLIVPRSLGRSLPRRPGEVRSLCLGFPTCGNKYLPVKPSQLPASKSPY